LGAAGDELHRRRRRRSAGEEELEEDVVAEHVGEVPRSGRECRLRLREVAAAGYRKTSGVGDNAGGD
jgi:hypothetical protein